MVKEMEYDLAPGERQEELVRFRHHHGVRVPPRLVGEVWVHDGMIPAEMDPWPQVGERWLRPFAAIASAVMIMRGILWTLFS